MTKMTLRLPVWLAAATLSVSALAQPAPAPTHTTAPGVAAAGASAGPADNLFRKVDLDADRDKNGDGKIDDTIVDPMELAVAKDGRVFYVERTGTVRVWNPQTSKVTDIASLQVFTTGGKNLEDGLLGITLDPDFLKNNWVYLYYSPVNAVENRLSRFTLKGEALDMDSEKVILRVATQRDQCCHAGGSLNFDAKGNLYLSTGDNTNPFESDGFSPSDERPNRSPWDAQKSSANANDLRGKILRIKPKADGTYEIPDGNLFKPGTEGTRPEVYVMGNRNPFRIGVDQKTGYLYWGDVGPDAGGPSQTRGPAGFDEVNQAKQAGNFGWPHFVADNKPYVKYNFTDKTSGELWNAQKPLNTSPNNTGIKELPPAQPAFIYYPASPSSRFPVLGSGGRTAMSGPVYYFDAKLDSKYKLPEYYDSTLFIYEWTRNWIMAVKLDKDGKIVKIEPFLKSMSFKRPMDMELGADGCLYLIEYGTNWGNNTDTRIVRIEYTGVPNETAATPAAPAGK